MECHFCRAKFPGHHSKAAQAWDWITGYLPAQEYRCPKCATKHAAMWAEIVRRAAIPPKQGNTTKDAS